ncbi:hypothetical protein SAY86_026002 [Trapa natans]|uniref:GTD-binding domain-containing protein n=1 Tax=Trapa natans TaxID=22666 RepID=A0AAN7QE53_TRANT|nr:hypothetical protein SAY86_026002 [Trapa natans]
MAQPAGIFGKDLSALKEALFDQQQLLLKLHTELDVEREASASATSEALSMILRLQGEKAAVEMEASQYKRMAEEKLCHAETSLEALEELIYHKEMEITSLEFQVQAYRYKLLSLGWTDVCMNDNRFAENMFPQKEDTGVNQTVRKTGPLPGIRWKDGYQRKGILSSSSGIQNSEAFPLIIEEYFDSETNTEMPDVEKKYGNGLTVGNLDSYWEQIRKLDYRVKELSKGKCSLEDENLDSCSISSSPMNLSCHLGRDNVDVEYYQSCQENASSCSMNVVQDIFEVPKNEDGYKTLVKGKSTSKVDYEALYSRSNDQNECIEELSSSNLRPRPSRLSDNKKKDAHPLESQLYLQQLVQRIERLEKSGVSQGRREVTREDSGNGELNLLREIRQQLNSIQNEMRCWRTKEEPPPDDTPMITLMEAMLHFWL